MIKYAIGIGSNLDDRISHLRAGAAELAELGDVRFSPVYESAPVGGPEQGPYLNAVAVLRSELDPSGLLAELQRIEHQQGRERELRWGARTLDLDIVYAEGVEIDAPKITVPHPRAHQRRFVVEPLADIWPEVKLHDGQRVTALLPELRQQKVDRLLRRWASPVSPTPGRAWASIQLIWFLATALLLAGSGSLPGPSLTPSLILGVALTGGGLALALAGGRALGVSPTINPGPVEGAVLVVDGPFKIVRHPIYTGVGSLFLGLSILLEAGPAITASIGLLVFFFFKARYEERHLRTMHPQYRAYRQEVRGSIIPYMF